MTLTPLPLTPPPRNIPALLQHVTPLITPPPTLHMATPHIRWEPRTLDLDDFQGHFVEMLVFKAVEIGVGVVGLDGVGGAGVGLRDGCAGEEGWEVFWGWARGAADCERVEGVVGLGFAEGVELRGLHVGLRDCLLDYSIVALETGESTKVFVVRKKDKNVVTVVRSYVSKVQVL